MKTLANVVSIFHDAIFYAMLLAAALFIAGGIIVVAASFPNEGELAFGKIAISAAVYIIELWGLMLLGWQLFRGDCPLSLLEYSLRGLGGYSFDFWKFKSMSVRYYTRSIKPPKIFRQLLWRSGLYTLVAGATIVSSIVAVVTLL